MIKAIALDDEKLATDILENYCSRISTITLLSTFNKVSEAKDFIFHNEVDIVFLDVEMPSMNGVTFAQQLPPKISVVFTTAYAEFAIDAFDVNAIDYLVKPISFDRFQKSIEKIHLIKGIEQVDSIFIKTSAKDVKVNYKEIVFIESMDDYIRVYLIDGSHMVSRFTLKSILEKLPPNEFRRIHRSYIVSLKYIKSIKNKTIQIADFVLPISDSYKNNLGI